MKRTDQRRAPRPGLLSIVNVVSVVSLFAFLFTPPLEGASEPPAEQESLQRIELRGLRAPVRVIRDAEGVPHIFARNELDASAALGWVQAEDRFFQMDLLRRSTSGTLAELFGEGALEPDVLRRQLGYRRGAEETWEALAPPTRRWLQAYARGVNSYLERHPLPPEYTDLELTRESVPPWTPIDTLVVVKGFLNFLVGTADIDFTVLLDAYQQAGEAGGFDGSVLFHEDVFRVRPFNLAPTLEGAAGPQPAAAPASSRTAAGQRPDRTKVREVLAPETLELARGLARSLSEVLPARGASNAWAVSGEHTASGFPLFASDPHLTGGTPSTLYEFHLLIYGNPRPANVTGLHLAGVPGPSMGCTFRGCFGVTVNPIDVSDIYQERLVLDPETGLPTHTLFRGEPEPLVALPQVYRANRLGDGRTDNLAEVAVAADSGAVVFTVPRRNMGPLLAFTATGEETGIGLSLQDNGTRVTREIETFRRLIRAHDVEDLRNALRFYDVSSFAFTWADVDGNVAFFSGGEMPLREDLELLGRPDGLSPGFIRDGTGARRNEWLPASTEDRFRSLNYEILPFEEMPQAVNPPSGVLHLNNNDLLGLLSDNDPLNQLRPTGGVLYLQRFGFSLRAGKVKALLAEGVARGELTAADFKRMQANNQLPDAEGLLPHLLAACENASEAGAPQALAGLATDPGVAEACARLGEWTLSTPTGIAAGYDPGDDPEDLQEPSAEEVADSVATTIYSIWRSEVVGRVIDGTLGRVGLGGQEVPWPGPVGSRQALVALRHLLDGYETARGMGSSGVDFFAEGVGLSRPQARDLALLASLRSALDLLAGEAYAAAFDRSTDQDDYRWGRLHRIVFAHPLGGRYSVPEAGPFFHLEPDLPGIARSGGLQTVDLADHSVQAAGPRTFQFGGAVPIRRQVALLAPDGIQAEDILPGGQSGDPESPHYFNQLGRWLTNRYRPVPISARSVRAQAVGEALFLPAAP